MGNIVMTKILGEMTTAALRDFANVGTLAGTECDLSKIRIEILNKPHKPSGPPTGKMAGLLFHSQRTSIEGWRHGTKQRRPI